MGRHRHHRTLPLQRKSTSTTVLQSSPAFALLDSSILQPRTMAAESQTVELKVAMSCGGCSGAVKRVLTKMQGVETFDIDMEQQKVTVKGNVTPEDVFQTVSKTGKKTSFWEAEATPVQATAPAAEAPAVAAATEAPAAAAATEAPPANTDA